jgi:hypothetical protein
MKIHTDYGRLIWDSQDPMNDVMISAGIEYSHKKKEGWGWKECEYMWKHHPTGKSGKTKIWVHRLEDLFALCYAWSRDGISKDWFYLPLTFS